MERNFGLTVESSIGQRSSALVTVRGISGVDQICPLDEVRSLTVPREQVAVPGLTKRCPELASRWPLHDDELASSLHR